MRDVLEVSWIKGPTMYGRAAYRRLVSCLKNRGCRVENKRVTGAEEGGEGGRGSQPSLGLHIGKYFG